MEPEHVDARAYVAQLRVDVPPFVLGLRGLLETAGVATCAYTCDHVCHRTSSQQEYTSLRDGLLALPETVELLVEGEIGGRMISTFRFREPIVVEESYSVACLEVPAPKPGKPYATGLEHAEFVLEGTLRSPVGDDKARQGLETFMASHPGVRWDTRALHKAVNPDVSATFEGGISAKFHLCPLEEVIEWEKEHDAE
mmetsp:Transcript_24147/g.70841  ORF Transcript_24147/g.70841 Transcript_24147/m.70841 type:complete len:197 (-) Transcript_24147:254-844(-)|eukprot:CAMPEP_0118978996 /NCGR_PEP_ID=MMETSP1173-20130426/24941_1 /TAXON_ID=1034831 /ORGANISM="Rhizochromulina marina cf, Strain CCMP1243" /LENGTH=196 /DNA_ID=CAMNT_0006929235 /DNA_START=137 /DNA_END=727 /DNA_ORIENTATION=-